jgi:hypothetical protein
MTKIVNNLLKTPKREIIMTILSVMKLCCEGRGEGCGYASNKYILTYIIY